MNGMGYMGYGREFILGSPRVITPQSHIFFNIGNSDYSFCLINTLEPLNYLYHKSIPLYNFSFTNSFILLTWKCTSFAREGSAINTWCKYEQIKLRTSLSAHSCPGFSCGQKVISIIIQVYKLVIWKFI